MSRTGPAGDAVAGTLVGLDDHGNVVLKRQALNDGSDATDADVTTAVDHFIVSGDGDQNAVLLKLYRGGGFGLVHFDAGLFDKYGCDDKEDQQDEYHVDHWREVDLDVVSVFGC